MTKQELDKNAARRLAIIRHAQEVTWNVALTCQYHGISRPGLLYLAAPLPGRGRPGGGTGRGAADLPVAAGIPWASCWLRPVAAWLCVIKLLGPSP